MLFVSLYERRQWFCFHSHLLVVYRFLFRLRIKKCSAVTTASSRATTIAYPTTNCRAQTTRSGLALSASDAKYTLCLCLPHLVCHVVCFSSAVVHLLLVFLLLPVIRWCWSGVRLFCCLFPRSSFFPGGISLFVHAVTVCRCVAT